MLHMRGAGVDSRIVHDHGISPTLLSIANTGGKHQAGAGHRVPIVASQVRLLTPTNASACKAFPTTGQKG